MWKIKADLPHNVTVEAPPPVGCSGCSCFVFSFLLQQRPAAALLLLISHSTSTSQKHKSVLKSAFKNEEKRTCSASQIVLLLLPFLLAIKKSTIVWIGRKSTTDSIGRNCISLCTFSFDFQKSLWIPKKTVTQTILIAWGLRPVHCMSRPFLWTKHLLANSIQLSHKQSIISKTRSELTGADYWVILHLINLNKYTVFVQKGQNKSSTLLSLGLFHFLHTLASSLDHIRQLQQW